MSTTAIAAARAGPAPATVAPPRRVAVLGIDVFARKNLLQVEAMGRRAVVYDVFATAANAHEPVGVAPPSALHLLPPTAAGRVAALWRYFRAHGRELHHAEVYPGGRFSAVYVEIARAFGVPVLVVERGDLVNIDRVGRGTRASMVRSYRRADLVWYREPYQERRLRALGVHRLAFLGNATGDAADVPPAGARDVHFLWVNRLVAERKAAWMVDALAQPAMLGTRNVMAGLLDPPTDAGIAENQAYVRAHAPGNLELLSYAAPQALYRRARFFVLPSDIVFCNNALLEAMAHGVVPLVSDVEGARRIVDDGVDGFVFRHDAAGLAHAMRAALALGPAEHAHMAEAARAKVRARFSADAWADALDGIYAALRPAPR